MSSWTIYKRLFLIARPYWLHVAGLFALTLVSVPLTLLAPLPLKIAVDSAIGSEPLPTVIPSWLVPDSGAQWRAALALTIGLLLGVTIVSQLQQLTRALLNTYVANRLVLRFRSELFRQVQRLSLSYHDTQGTGDTLYRIQYDATSIQNVVIDGVIPFVVSASTVVSMLYVTMRIDAPLALVALTVVPVLIVLISYFRPKLRTLSKEVRKLESSAMSVVQETLGAVRVVKAFGQEDREQNRFNQQSGRGIEARLRLSRLERSMGMGVALVIAVGTSLVLYVGVIHVRAQTLTVGNLLLIMGYLASLYTPLRTVSSRIARMQQYLTSAERAFALLDQAPDVPEKPDAVALTRARGAIRFEQVAFSYDGANEVLKNVELVIMPGSRVGIVGVTGAGKTTLLNLMLRLYDPTRGRILLDGIDLRDYRVADLRNQFSVVLQEPVLFSTTVAENIAYARPEASTDDIMAAAKAANAHDFIVALPAGYETQVGERGMLLSGGERQRISLARAFLKDAPLLMLDEPTSSVDTGTELLIIDAMTRLMANRTTFMIAHRLSTLDSCDAVVRVAEGIISLYDPQSMAAGTLLPAVVVPEAAHA